MKADEKTKLDEKKKLGEKIKELRKGRFTQAELSELIGIHENTLRRWESGERSPNAEDLMNLTQALNVSISELMGENDENMTQKKIPISSSKITKGMLVYERDGERLELPPTEEGYLIMNHIASAIVNRTAAL